MQFKKITAGLIFFVCFTGATAQKFYGSRLLQFFNRGEYQTTVDSIRSWMAKTPSDHELAYYYIGESHYNLGLVAKDAAEAEAHFEQALLGFGEALKLVPIQQVNPMVYDNALYKKAWTHFRLAELKGGVFDEMEKANQDFQDLTDSEDDSVRIYAGYMVGETDVRLAFEYRIHMSVLNQSTFGQKAVDALTGARDAFRSVLSSAKAPVALKVAASIRARDAEFEHGLLFQNISESNFKTLNDDSKRPTVAQTEKDVLAKLHYLDLQDSVLWDARPALSYSEMMAALYLFLASGAATEMQILNKMLEDSDLKPFMTEQALAKVVRDSRELIDNAAISDSVSFYKIIGTIVRQNLAFAVPHIPEAYYWMGILQAAAKMPECENIFKTFLAETEPLSGESKTKILREDAKIQLLTLAFRQAVSGNSVAALKGLKSEIDQIKLEIPFIREKRDLLLELTKVLLEPKKVWENLSGSSDARLNAIFRIVRNLLIRTNQVVGQDRRNLLNKIQILFESTKRRRPEETRFYEGLYRFLDAEIQVKGQAEKYKDTADWIKGCKGDFFLEGQYIRARSLLAADDFKNSRDVFIGLINDSKSLRSAYFLGEIFRMGRNRAAARKCYEAVMQKTGGDKDGDIWYNNASAANKILGDMKDTEDDLSALDGIRLDQVQFPEKGGWISEIAAEQYVEPLYQKIQALKEGLDLFVQFGIPRRELYPSVFQPNDSHLKRLAFDQLTAGIREKTGTVKSMLRLSILFPQGGPQDVKVALNGQFIDLDHNASYQKAFLLGDTVNVRVASENYYPISQRILFVQPKQTRVVIPLVPYLTFQKTEEKGAMALIRFPNRPDANAVFFEGGEPAISATWLYNTFQSNVLYRDFVYSKAHRGCVAVNARSGNLYIYPSDADLSKEEELKTVFPDSSRLVSPEGVAVDSKGNFYVVDWAQHKIFAFGPDGVLLRSFGGYGENTSADVGKAVHFSYPTRIAIAQDLEGVDINGERYYRPLELFVADRYGIHFIDDQGTYLNTVVFSPSDKGSFSALAVEGYGAGLLLSVYNRKTGTVQRFSTGTEVTK